MAQHLNSKLPVVAALALMVVASGGTLYFKVKADAMQQAPERDNEEPLLAVNAYSVSALAYPLRFQCRGVLEGIQETTISAEVEGLVLSRPIEEGQVVKAGDLLCQIDRTFHELALQQAQARLEGAKADLASAEAVLGRVRELETNHTTELELKQRTSERDRTRAAKDLAAAEVDQAAERLARCKIVSPIDGVISRIFVEVGELLTPMAPAVEIVNDEQMKVLVELTDFEAAQLKLGAEVQITSQAWPNEVFSGTVRTTYPKSDPNTRRVPVEIRIVNREGKLRSGSFVNCTIISGSTTPKLLVPAQAVLRDFGAEYCYVAEPYQDAHIVRRRPITTATLPGSVTLLEVTRGLSEYELLIVNKHQEIAADLPVTVRPVLPFTDLPSPNSDGT